MKIKFRLWDKANKKMSKSFDPLTSAGAIALLETVAGRKLRSSQLVKLQFTGLKDKNGRDIYNCDIIKSKFGEIIEIASVPGAFIAHVRQGGYNSNTRGCDTFSLASAMFSELECEVVGNVFENRQIIKRRRHKA